MYTCRNDVHLPGMMLPQTQNLSCNKEVDMEKNNIGKEVVMTDRERDLAYKPVLPLFLKLFAPALVAMIVQAIYMLVDRIFIARIPEAGKYAIGGVGVMMPLYFILMGIYMLFSIGGAANISISIGKRDYKSAEKFFGNSITLLLVTVAIVTAFFMIFSRILLMNFGATEKNIDFAHAYFFILLIGTMWNSVAFTLNQVIRSEGAAKFSMFSMLIGAIANLILDPIFIFTLNMGVEGAAYATIISQFLTFLFCIYYFKSGKSSLHPSPKAFIPDIETTKSIVAIGFSPFFKQAAASFVMILTNNLLRHYGGEFALSANSIMGSLIGFVLMPVFAMNQALQPIIGYNYGAKNYQRVSSAFTIGIIAASIHMTAVWIFTTFLTWLPVSTMAVGDELITITSEALFHSALFIPLYGIVIISGNYFTSIGKARTAFIITISREFIMYIPMMYAAAHFFGLKGIWWVMGLVDIPCFVMTLLFVVFEIKQIRLLETKQPALQQS